MISPTSLEGLVATQSHLSGWLDSPAPRRAIGDFSIATKGGWLELTRNQGIRIETETTLSRRQGSSARHKSEWLDSFAPGIRKNSSKSGWLDSSATKPGTKSILNSKKTRPKSTVIKRS